MNTQQKPQLSSKTIVYVPLYQGNHIAAAVFDWVLTYTEIETRLRYHEPFYVYVESTGGPLADPGPFQDCLGYQVDVDANLEVELADLRDVVTPQLIHLAVVTDQDLFDALDLLREIHLVSWSTIGEETRLPDQTLYFSTIYLPRVNEALVALHDGHHVTEKDSR